MFQAKIIVFNKVKQVLATKERIYNQDTIINKFKKKFLHSNIKIKIQINKEIILLFKDLQSMKKIIF